MKRIVTLLLVALLLLTPCAAFAQGSLGGLLGGLLNGNTTTETEEPALPVTLYTMTEAGITIELPEEWLVLTTEPGTESLLATLMGGTAEEVASVILTPMGGHLYAVTDLMFSGQLFIVLAEGMSMDIVDMRVDKMTLDLDSFMTGFVEGFSQSIPEEDIIACESFSSEIAHFARIIFTSNDGTGDMVSVQYCTNVNGMIYIIQYVGAGTQISEETLALLDTAIGSLKFIETVAE